MAASAAAAAASARLLATKAELEQEQADVSIFFGLVGGFFVFMPLAIMFVRFLTHPTHGVSAMFAPMPSFNPKRRALSSQLRSFLSVVEERKHLPALKQFLKLYTVGGRWGAAAAAAAAAGPVCTVPLPPVQRPPHSSRAAFS